MKKCLLRFKTGEILRTFSHTLTCLMNMVSKHGLMRIQVSRNITAKYTIRSKKIYIGSFASISFNAIHQPRSVRIAKKRALFLEYYPRP